MPSFSDWGDGLVDQSSLSGAVPQHIEQIRRLDLDTSLPVWSAEEYAGLMARKDVYFQVALDAQDLLLGFCITLLTVVDAEIVKIAVNPGRQGKGIGSRLLRQALKFAGSRKCEACFLEVRPSNQSAIRFYERHGFRVVGRRKDYYAQPREDAFVMRLYLDSWAKGGRSGRELRRIISP